jgi:hypothetical protein
MSLDNSKNAFGVIVSPIDSDQIPVLSYYIQIFKQFGVTGTLLPGSLTGTIATISNSITYPFISNIRFEGT